ncbi:hypothetical protein LOCC1_G005344 [Lachnellula occidentalis]|uniref:Tyrosine specific protein phosphatases domain-containing protein n=1 Tax=Lachnellula occidentalis TaxID=215460 RepID=A0A8H8UFU0_9HELO|nr:hypothetical protein LOCC1_G005344 [Lachnellula occidentalis]
MAGDKVDKKMDIQTAELPHGPFENILNFRDVGKTINEFLAENVGGAPFTALSSHTDQGSTEHANQARKRDGDLQIPALVKSNAALAEPVQIPGMSYLEININGKGFERSLLWQLSYWSFTKLIVLMIFGYRMQAISILGREVMQPRGLVGLGFDSIDHCGHEIADALREFSNPTNAPILTHCTQGKDRTGLLIALILFLMQIPIPAITHDYILSEAELFPERESRLVEIRSIGLTEDFAGCPKEWIEEMEKHLGKYGGVRQYCRGIGFTEVDEERLIVGLTRRSN